MYKSILESLEKLPDDEAIYLIHRITDKSGLFGSHGKLVYMVKNIENLKCNNIDTEYLSMSTHVYISAINNSTQFNNGYYNLIIYKDALESDIKNTFIRLSIIHSEHLSELSFWDFFYSLVNLFKPSQDQQFKNLLGFWGELAFMKYVDSKVGYDISGNWHRKGEFSKYDISNSKMNIEIKTTIGEYPIVKIKHAQIFNTNQVYLIAVCVQESDDGSTVFDLIDELRIIPDRFNSLSFNIGIEHELMRVSYVEAKEKRFKLLQVFVYDADEINPFDKISYAISDLHYIYDLSDHVPIDIIHNPTIFEPISS